MNVYTPSGKAIVLNAKALASGGEGAVYEILGYPKKVVKKYHDSANPGAHEEKISKMVDISRGTSFTKAKLAEVIAWPLSPVYDVGHTFIGFGMNKINAKSELDDLYVYPPKKNVNVTVANKLECAISLCDIVARLHEENLCFGDGNPVNLKIDDNFNVYFLDADSFHFVRNGKLYKCEVCASGYVAPELIKKCKGTTYAACTEETFNKHTDNFSLAIHIFRLLFNGAHPYICQRQLKRAGSAPAPKSTDKRVECGETPFFKTIPNHTTPNYAPDIKSVPPYIRDLFERAFVAGHTDPSKRPNAREWKAALEKMQKEMKHCTKNHAHDYWSGNKSCPYCEADKRYAEKMNASMALTTTGGTSGPKTASPTHTVTVTPPVAAAPTYVPVRNVSRGTSGFAFWSITILLSLAIMSLLGNFALPELYYSITGDHTLMMIGVIGSCISGFVGTLVYNGCWAPGKYQGGYAWWEYVLSILTGLGFVVGFGLAMALIAIALTIIFYVLAVCAIIGIIVGIFSGG